jgi:thioesterase domain-containing protein
VHPGEGEIGYARVLAQWLDVEIPIHGFAAAGFMPGEQPHATIEAMASSYLSGMRSVQPIGPYRIAGWSLGGTIAHEMARQLIAAGERVQFLGLIDTRPSYGPVQAVDPSESMQRDARYLLEMMAAASPSTRALLAMHARLGDVAAMVEVCRCQALLPADLDTSTLCRHVAVRAALLAAARAYVPQRLPIKACLFSAAESEDQDLHRDWHVVTESDINHVKVPGTHYSMVEEPNARSLAAAIGGQILEMEQQGAASANARTCEEQEA